MGCVGEVREGTFDFFHVVAEVEEGGHGGAEEDDAGILVLVEVFTLKVSADELSTVDKVNRLWWAFWRLVGAVFRTK